MLLIRQLSPKYHKKSIHQDAKKSGQKTTKFQTVCMLFKCSKVCAIQDWSTPGQFHELTQLGNCERSLNWATSADEINPSHMTL